MKPRQFVDSTICRVAAGDGGNGIASFRREKYVPRGGPDGGDGGRGGHVLLEADPNADSLTALFFAPDRKAEHGGHGRNQRCHGRNGRDLILPVPIGTEVWDQESRTCLGDLLEAGSRLLVAEGGRGGLGNCHWATATHQTPHEHTDGQPGEKRTLRLELKIVADVGLVGFPNAGKSSLLSAISHAHPRVAAYPFTTLVPVIGTVEGEDYSRYTVADIPGILPGAHQGVGLGVRFLRHIERTEILAFVLDMTGGEGRDPVDDYDVLRDELTLYQPALAHRTFLVIANKMDGEAAAEHLDDFRRRTGLDPLPVSALTGQGCDALRLHLGRLVRRLI